MDPESVLALDEHPADPYRPVRQDVLDLSALADDSSGESWTGESATSPDGRYAAGETTSAQSGDETWQESWQESWHETWSAPVTESYAPTDQPEEAEVGELLVAEALPFGTGLALVEALSEVGAGSAVEVAAFAFGDQVLRRGSRGPGVVALQRALTTLGTPLTADGDFGPLTEQAVRRFQVSAGLTVDGVVGPRTKVALSAALARRGTGPAPAPTPTPAPPPPAGSLPAAIARVAEAEFARWNPAGQPRLQETHRAAGPILQEYYRTGVRVEVTLEQMASETYQRSNPWSAVFISHVMRTAGAGDHFTYSRAHQAYIREARRNRLDGRTSNPFWAYRVGEIAPRVGDLVCADRGSGATYDNIGDNTYRATHCDVVTAVAPGQLRTIGGNVSQAVGCTELRTGPDGRLRTDGSQARYFAVISSSGSRAPGPAPPAAPATTQEARIRRVVELLTGTYGYPVNAAAGIVGNLLAESGVQPDRLEGSRPETPMRAKDMSGRVRDFTPEEIRDRDRAAGRGPLLPGVGIAQWTSRDRRAGLFRHSFRGRVLGTAVLTDLDAQVDYLVGELRGPYRAVDAVLRDPAVSVEAAADEVVYRFEVPGAVLQDGRLRPRSDPQVQEVFRRRRALAHQALRVATGRP
ncbi:Putative peptidoglycan binding domain-containing protein [Geodermatophilus dictyosporus]|uniref:Putative peptidoglycan binding domain-containing protein n=1 Tax=Geodermatophilus dictyosporus TaxID=1523247 RepID=A0A1I5R621_9ACTN|nr:phage tail tip lysozyme [Geodermatophilus dictyosporus]SFP53953.1 Putative peptidoglycan binding domain-containing protein [Geodermatophilus dictyosporus]